MNPHRQNIIDTLQLIASIESQLDYQTAAPTVNVASELVNQWFDDFYHPGFPEFDCGFSKVELLRIDSFSKFYESKLTLLPDTLSDYMQSPTWLSVVKEAQHVLADLSWQNESSSQGA